MGGEVPHVMYMMTRDAHWKEGILIAGQTSKCIRMAFDFVWSNNNV